MARNRVFCPHFPHQRQLIAVEVAGNVAAELLPAVAAVRALEEIIRAHVHGVVIMRRDDNGSTPVPAKLLLAKLRLRLNAFLLARLYIVAYHAAVLELRVHDIWIRGIDSRVKS